MCDVREITLCWVYDIAREEEGFATSKFQFQTVFIAIRFAQHCYLRAALKVLYSVENFAILNYSGNSIRSSCKGEEKEGK